MTSPSHSESLPGEPSLVEKLSCELETLKAQLRIEQSARLKAEELAHANEEVLQRFMDHSPIYVFFKDANLRAVRLSSNFEQLVGKPVEQILGKTMDEIFPLDFAKKMIEDDQAVMSGGKPVILHEEFLGRHYTTIKFPILYDGVPRYLAGYTIDVTEQHQTEAALRIQNAKLEEALGNVKTLRGLLPICSGCKKIRDDKGYWSQVDCYLQSHSDATFTHGFCPDCAQKFYPELLLGEPDKP